MHNNTYHSKHKKEVFLKDFFSKFEDNLKINQKPCTIKLLSCLVRDNMETYYPCT